jgi:hypothetical protein
MKKILTIIVASVWSAASFAQVLPSLLVNSDPQAMGAAGISVLGSPAYALQGYAASTVFMEGTGSAGVSYGSWQPKAASDKILGASASVRMGKLGVALEYKNFAQPAYEVTGITGSVSQVTPSFTPKESSFALGLGYRILDCLSAAVTVRSTSSVLASDAKASVFGVDVSAMYASDALQAGLAVCNLGGKVNYGESDYKQPALLKAGAAYEVIEGLKAAAEFAYLFEGAFGASLGAEYCYADIVSARAGYHLGSKDKGLPSYASIGLGAKYFGIGLNLSYLLASDTIGGSFLAGLSYSF